MGQKDITEKILADYKDVFSDIVNVLLFQGKELVQEDDLENCGMTSMYKADQKIHEQERDTSKVWKKGEVKISIFGLEHQTKYDSLMPLRVMGYDGASYRSQCLDSEGNKYPVITMVLHFGMEKWNKNKSLSECFSVSKELEPYFSDYRINVFDIAYLSDEQVAMFKSDFQIVADYFVQMRKNKDYQPSVKTIKHVDEILKLMSVLTEDTRFETVQNSERKVHNMSEFLNAVEEKGRAQGRAQGRAEERIKAIKRLIQKEQGKEFILSLGYSEEEYREAEESLFMSV